MSKKLFVATGAFDTGKTTTLEYLRDEYGYIVHDEAHNSVLRDIGNRSDGHPPNEPFKKITHKNHFCPMCNSYEFALLVLKKQIEIETNAKSGDVLERGFPDPIEYYLRNNPSVEKNFHFLEDMFVNYAGIFLFDVIKTAQKSRWGKSTIQRIDEALVINEKLYRMYTNKGFKVYRISASTTPKRAEQIHGIISWVTGNK